jgi:hypothetical protein
VSIEVSDDRGATYDVAVQDLAFGSDIGYGVRPGRDRRIVWNAKSDWVEQESYGMRVRLTAEVSEIDTRGDLIAYYPFDGDALDYSGSGNHSDQGQAFASEDRNSMQGRALTTDGSTRIVLPNLSSFLNYDKKFSVAFWAKLEVGSDHRLLAGTDGGSRDVQFQFTADYVKLSNQADTNDWRVDFQNPTRTIWNHYAFTFNPTKGLLVYLNGALVGEDREGLRANFYPNAGLSVGGLMGRSVFSKGSFDDLRIYRRDLAPSEVSVLAGLKVTTSNKEIVAHYKLDGDVSDSSGNGYNGVNHGAIQGEDRLGDPSGAMYFDGNDWVELGTDNELFGAEPLELTVCFWGLHEGIGRNETFIASYDSGGYDGYYLIGVVANEYGDSVTSAFRTTVGSHLGGGNTTPVEKNKWHHYAVVISRETQKSRLYLDGNFISEADLVAGSSYLDGGRVFLGKSRFNGSDVWSPLHGALDDLRIYHRVLDDGEIELLAK